MLAATHDAATQTPRLAVRVGLAARVRRRREREAAAAAAWAALAAENDRLRRENAQLRRPKVPRALRQLAPYNTPGPRSTAFVSSDDESAPNVAALPEVGAEITDPGLLYEQVSEAEVKDDAEQNLRAEAQKPGPDGEAPRTEVLAELPQPPPPVLGERPPSHVLLQVNEQGELHSEDEDEAPTRLRSKPRKRKSPPLNAPRKRSKKSPPPCHAGLTTSLHIALADGRWNALEKWTFEHAANPYPSAEDKADLARKAGWPRGTGSRRVQHWFSNMRKRKYLKLRDGTRAPRGAFEAQLYQFMPIEPATDADEGGQEDADVNSALPEAAPAPSPTDEPAGDAAAPDAAGSEYSDDDDDDDEEEEEEEDDGGEWSPDTPVVRRKKKKKAPRNSWRPLADSALSAAAFPRKLLDLVEDTDVPEIAWNEDGTGVSVQKGPALDRVLEDRFAMTKGWESLLRQLNLYNFTRSSREGNTVVYESAAFTRTSTPAQIVTIRALYQRERAQQSSLPVAWQKAGLTERPRDPPSAPGPAAPTPRPPASAAAAPIVPGATADVNPKQSGRIMKRRQARLKFATMDKVSQARANYAHESRCRRASKRKRDATGHFAARKKADGAPLHDLLDLFADDDKEE